mmetsp:Transcript_3245/g.6062  ORF Transcript_3245/g.6062 Transcript_3245/m.6062 type:complete len:115 (+) Transcript_3245:285-629(+)
MNLKYYLLCHVVKIAIVSRKFSNNTNKLLRGEGRKTSPIEPPATTSETSTFYRRRIYNRDFHEVVDEHHTDEQRARTKDTEIYGMTVRTNDTMDSITTEDESAFLSLVLLAICR